MFEGTYSLSVHLWNNIPVSVFFMTLESYPRFVAANPAAVKLYGYDCEQDMLMVPLSDVFNDPADLAGIFTSLQSDEKTVKRVCRQKKKDKAVFWADMNVSRITDEKGHPCCLVTIEDMTEQKYNEIIPEWGKKEWETVFNTVKEPTFITDTMCRVVRCNDAMVNRLKTPRRNIIGKDVRTIFYDNDAPDIDPFEVGRTEVFFPKLEADFIVASNPIHNLAGVESMFHVMTDITERADSELSIQKQETYFKTMAEKLPISIYIVQDGFIRWANPAFYESTGYGVEEIVGNDCLKTVHPEDREMVRRHAVAMLQGKNNQPYEYRIINKDGTVKWYVETVASINVQGRRAVLGDQMDITPQKAAEQSLRTSEERYRTIIETIPDAYYEVDLAGNTLMFNEAYPNLFERPRKNLQGINYKDYMVEKSAREIFKIFNEVYRTGRDIKSQEFEILTPAGTIKPLELSIGLIRDSEKKPTGFRGIIRDVTERKRIENIIRRREERYRMILEHMAESYYEMDLKGKFVFCNNYYLENTGFTFEELQQLDIRKYMDDRNLSLVRKVFAEVYRTGKPIRDFQVESVDKLGKNRLVESTINLMRDAKGKPTGFSVISRDISERRQREMQELLSQKLESVGQLAAGIAHEINTPIQFVGDNVEFMKDAFEDIFALVSILDLYGSVDALKDYENSNLMAELRQKATEIDFDYLQEEIPKAIRQSQDGLLRVSRIVRAMREFSHPGSEEKSELNINEAIESTITLTRNEWKYTSELVTNLAPDLPPVRGFPADFNQVILNLIVNAAQAVQDKIDQNGAKKGYIEITTRRDDGDVEIRIRDTGMGIPAEVQPRIFDPFFTTKDVGKGTGQGLAIARNIIVKKHGGKIYFDTVMGEGTTFHIRLPIGNE